jgi:hypothetical protein
MPSNEPVMGPKNEEIGKTQELVENLMSRRRATPYQQARATVSLRGPLLSDLPGLGNAASAVATKARAAARNWREKSILRNVAGGLGASLLRLLIK